MNKAILAAGLAAILLAATPARGEDVDCRPKKGVEHSLATLGAKLQFSGQNQPFSADSVDVWTHPDGTWWNFSTRGEMYCEIASGHLWIRYSWGN